MSAEINPIGIVYLLVLITPLFWMNKRLNIPMNKQIIIALVRMMVQLALVAVYLKYLFEWNLPWLNLMYLLVMMSVATSSIASSTGLKIKKMYPTILVSIVVPTLLLVIFFNRFVVGITNVLDARYVITIGGMMLGNILSGDIIALNTFYNEVDSKRKLVNYDLGLGATRMQAVAPYLTQAIMVTIKPNIATMATIGLVALPGMMTGQILGGSLPTTAVLYQIAILIAVYFIRYIGAYGVLRLSQHSLFEPNDQLIKIKK